jgi:hypothetical protein
VKLGLQVREIDTHVEMNGVCAIVRFGRLTEIQKRAYLIADNKLATGAGWLLLWRVSALAELAQIIRTEPDAMLARNSESSSPEFLHCKHFGFVVVFARSDRI